MPVLDAIENMSSIARIDPTFLPDEVWVGSMMPPGQYDGYQVPAIRVDISTGRWLGKSALAPLFADERAPASTVIEVVPRIPHALRAAMAAYPRELIDPRDDIGPSTEELRLAVAELGGTMLRTAVAPAGKANTTRTPATGDFQYPGLLAAFHTDCRGGGQLASRIKGQRRFIPSRGPGMRMAGICLPDIVSAGRTLGLPDDESIDYDVYREYLRCYPDSVVCIGIPIKPGQGSLINTDLVIHDGMTLNETQGRESLTFQMLGNWGLRELANIA